MAGSCVLQRGLRHFSFGGGGGWVRCSVESGLQSVEKL